jgi:phosphoribosylglycinamide formyltransferase-1
MRVALLGSGRGSNAEAILLAREAGGLGAAEVIGIWSDLPEAPILGLGPRFGIPATYLDPGPFRTKFSPERETAWAEALTLARADLIVLAGFMRVLKEPLLRAFPRRIINLHPSLLPDFPGLDGIGQTWRSGADAGGCTVHWVSEAVDAGDHLGQVRVARRTEDTLESFAARIHEAEHRLLPEVIARLSRQPLP